jgi:hypothetical protein
VGSPLVKTPGPKPDRALERGCRCDVANRFSGEANPESVMPQWAEVRRASRIVGWFVMTRSAWDGDWGES